MIKIIRTDSKSKDFIELVKLLDKDCKIRISGICNSNCVIRNWIYRLLKDDMREIFKEHGENI